MLSVRKVCGTALLLAGVANAELICFFTDATCMVPSQTMPCQRGTPNTGLCGPAVMGSYATFTNNQGQYSFSVFLDPLCAGPALINVNAAANQCAQVIGIPVIGNVYLQVTPEANDTTGAAPAVPQVPGTTAGDTAAPMSSPAAGPIMTNPEMPASLPDPEMQVAEPPTQTAAATPVGTGGFTAPTGMGAQTTPMGQATQQPAGGATAAGPSPTGAMQSPMATGTTTLPTPGQTAVPNPTFTPTGSPTSVSSGIIHSGSWAACTLAAMLAIVFLL